MNQMQQIPMQPMPVQYTICRASNPSSLEEEVNRKLSDGFTLHGPTFVDSSYYVQPLVKLQLKPIALPQDEKEPIVHNVPSSVLLG